MSKLADGNAAAGGDVELKLLLTELKSKQKALVLPIVLSLGLILQSFAPGLEPLKPLGWYGGIHCTAAFLFSMWQDVPDLGMARQRSLYRPHAYLVLSSVGFATCLGCRAVQDDLLLTLVLIFLLPVTSCWEIRDLDFSDGAGTPFHSYLALHLAMTCSQFRDDFWSTGWKFCLVSLILDLLLVLILRDRAALKRQLLDSTCVTLRRLLTAVCDGCCIVTNTGDILLSDGRIVDFMGGASVLGLSSNDLDGSNSDVLDGLPFSTLLAVSDKPLEKNMAEGTRIARLRCVDGVPMNVEITSVKCSLSSDVVSRIFGRKGVVHVSHPNCFLCVIRQLHAPGHGPSLPIGGLSDLQSGTLDNLRPKTGTPTQGLGGDRQPNFFPSNSSNSGPSRGMERTNSHEKPPRLEESTLERLRAGGLGGSLRGPSPKSQLGSEVGRGSLVCGSRVSEVGRASQVSGFSNTSSTVSARHEMTSALTLANRRLQLMGKDRANGGLALDRGTPMILEMDLPASEVSSVVSEVHHCTSGPSPMNLRMRMAKSRSSAGTEHIDSDDGEEILTTEVRSIGPAGPDGNVRVQLAFRSQMFSQQFARLDSSEMELQNVRRDMRVRNEVEEESKAVLKKFQKMVTREFDDAGTTASLNITIFIFDSRDDVRALLEELCTGLGYTCRVFSTVSAGAGALQEETGIRELAHGVDTAQAVVGTRSVGGRLKRPTWRSPVHTQIVLLGTPLLEQLRAEWRAAGVYVVLFGTPEELGDIGEYLGAPDEDALRETLRALGVCEHVAMPFGKSSVVDFAKGAMRHRFGGDFLLVQNFGRGATGPVYGAKRLRDGEVFALKEVNVTKIKQLERARRNQVSPGKAGLAHEWKEVEILGCMKWPTVAELIDSWTASAGKLVYMLMPALVGGNLQEAIEKAEKLGEPCLKGDLVVEWYAQALHGISYLHWCGVVHRDIKTDNLMLDMNHRSLRIADLGSAMLLPGPGPHPARRNCVRGDVTTIRITPPEVFSKRLFYPSSDLWSLGATFYEALSMKPLINCELPPDELLALASAMDELPERTTAASVAGSGSGGSGHLTAGIVSSYVKLLHQAQPVAGLASELMELLRSNPLRRPLAATLCTRPRTFGALGKVLEAGLLWEPTSRTQHLAEFDRLLAESTKAAEADPPKEAVKSEAEGEAEAAMAAA